jgi:SAM-dependent methyltransferase
MAGTTQLYKKFASVYDNFGFDNFSIKMVDYTRLILEKLHFTPESILDLCCGTGTAAILWVEKGYKVAALDQSKDMLVYAIKKARKKRARISFYRGKLDDFHIRKTGKKELRQFDLITCFFDSINYLLDEEKLKKCFYLVNAHLRPGGYFIFDMNTHHGHKSGWGNNCHVKRDSRHFLAMQAKFDKESGQAELLAALFTKKGKSWELSEEIHRQRAYPNSRLESLLRRSGFNPIKIYRCLKFNKPNAKTNRIAIVARKKI